MNSRILHLKIGKVYKNQARDFVCKLKSIEYIERLKSFKLRLLTPFGSAVSYIETKDCRIISNTMLKDSLYYYSFLSLEQVNGGWFPDLFEYEVEIDFCSHDPVNTGFKKTWCKKCNRDGEQDLSGQINWKT